MRLFTHHDIIYCIPEKVKDHKCVRIIETLDSYVPMYRSQMFFKISVLKHFANFTRKSLRWSLFLTKPQAFRCAILLKETPTQRSPRGICEICKNTFFAEHLQWLLLCREGFLKKENFLKHDWIKKDLPFQDLLYHFAYLYFSTTVHQLLPYIGKEVDRTEKL